jgi:hypothetical protein
MRQADCDFRLRRLAQALATRRESAAARASGSSSSSGGGGGVSDRTAVTAATVSDGERIEMLAIRCALSLLPHCIAWG